MAEIKDKVLSLVTHVKENWNEPQKGKNVPYKEVATLGVAGFGVQWASMLASTLTLDAGNFLVGASIGLKPTDLYWMLLAANIIGMPLAFFRGWYFDNHNMKGGKFIPFIVRSSFPLVFLAMLFVWLPFENWDYTVKAVVTWFFYMVMQFFLCFYNDGWAFLQQVISPDAQERATVMSISQIIYSLAPSLSNFLIPTIAGLTYGLDNIWTYRVIYPFFCIAGLIINVIFFRKVKERIIIPKRGLEYVRISDALREVAKNKYFWIINIASWVGFLEYAYGVILSWSFVYADGGSNAPKLGIANTVIGNAALWAMALAPIVIKKIGKRNMLILSNIINVVILTIMYFVFENIIAVCVLWFINNFILVFSNNIFLPNVQADMRDYHQWKTGVRVDGLFAPLTLIGTVIGFFTGMIIPSIYEKMGVQEDYTVLYDDTIRNNLFRALIISSIIGAILNLIPYLFYDLTEDKHKGYINVLKIRAMFEDYGNNELDEKELIDAMEIINSAREADGMKKMPCQHSIVLDELNKFNTERYKKQLEKAKETFANGELYVYENVGDEFDEARALPKKSKEEKQIRADMLSIARTKKVANKLIKKYGDSLTAPSKEVEEEIKNRETTSLVDYFNQRRELKAYVKAVSNYRRATLPYENAKKLIIQAENYTQLSKIEELYEKAVSGI